MGAGEVLQVAVGGAFLLGLVAVVVVLNRWDRAATVVDVEASGPTAGGATRRPAGSAVACIVLGVGFLGVGLCLLLLPVLVTLADGGRITARLDVDAERLASLYLLTVGSTCCIVGAIFLAAWLRPR